MARKIGHIPQQLEALQKAIAICGSRRELARRISVYMPCTSGRIDMWFSRNTMVPMDAAPFIAAAVDGEVSVYELCPEYSEGWQLLSLLLVRERRSEQARERIA